MIWEEGIGLDVVDKRWWSKRTLLIALSHILNITLIQSFIGF